MLEHPVFLQYAVNPCCTTLTELPPEGVTIDDSGRTWSFAGRVYEVGKHIRRCEPGSRSGIIGVYDRMNTEHLNLMLHHAREATAERSFITEID